MSEARIAALARRMAKEMLRRGAVKCAGGEATLGTLLARAIIAEQAIEEQIDNEARALLARQPRLPPPGTGEYQAAFIQTRRQLASRRGRAT
jgi:hypothetical protein